MVHKVLYLLSKNPPDAVPLVMPSPCPSDSDVSVILLQDAVSLTEPLPGSVYVLADDATARKVASPFPQVSYREMLQMIFSADRVIAG